jgi:hypothetical protein
MTRKKGENIKSWQNPFELVPPQPPLPLRHPSFIGFLRHIINHLVSQIGFIFASPFLFLNTENLDGMRSVFREVCLQEVDVELSYVAICISPIRGQDEPNSR